MNFLFHVDKFDVVIRALMKRKVKYYPLKILIMHSPEFEL
ncbi:hypothetical protein FIC_00357 [Flavobacteriaceae bacterium 3519-10]|nr:hypothetical protein FIC_00357 [Flavobacteriaceae bacterium 3519-10]